MAYMNPRQLVDEFWRRMNANDWTRAAELFSEGCVVVWPQSGERIVTRSDFAALNAAYPSKGRWRFDVRRTVQQGGIVVTETTVTDGEARATALSFFETGGGGITRVIEYWPDPFPAPPWRARWVRREADAPAKPSPAPGQHV